MEGIAKARAFELFAQGKRPGDHELNELGLKKASQNKYFGAWRIGEAEAQPSAKPEVKEVAPKPDPNAPVVDSSGKVVRGRIVEHEPEVKIAPTFVLRDTLVAGQEFELDGTSYKIRSNYTCALLEWAPSGKFKVEKHTVNIHGDTLVLPT